MKEKNSVGRSPEFRAAFTASIPVLLGYLAIGMAFGLMLNSAGYPWWLAILMSTFMLAGAGQYMAVGMFTRGANLGELALMTFLVNARHMVYGISLLEKFRGLGAKKLYLMFALTDETYALLTTVRHQEGIKRSKVYFWIALLDHVYWVVGTLIGVIAGTFLPIPTEDLGFTLTALFAVLAVERWMSGQQERTFFIALVAIVAGSLIAGTNLLLPSIGIGLALLIILDFTKTKEQDL